MIQLIRYVMDLNTETSMHAQKAGLNFAPGYDMGAPYDPGQ